MMVSIWWIPAAVIVGMVLGVFVIAITTADKDRNDDP